MDSLTTAELLELILITNESLMTNFQLWIMITFVVFIARYTVKKRLEGILRISISMLYVAITIVFMIRSASVGIGYVSLVLEATNRGVELTGALAINVSANLLLAVYVFGTALTVWYLNSKTDRFEDAET